MSFIKNIKTGITTECINEDVIKVCKADPLNYIVEDSLEALLSSESSEEKSAKKNKPLSKMNIAELKELAKEMNIDADDSLTKDELFAKYKEYILPSFFKEHNCNELDNFIVKAENVFKVGSVTLL